MRRVINSGGLGAALEMYATPAAINQCNSAFYYANPFCWRYTRDAWMQMAALPAIPMSVFGQAPAVPFGDSTVPMPVSVAEAQAAGQAASDQQISDTQDKVQQFVESLPDNPIPDVPCTWMNIPCTWLWVGGGVAGLLALTILSGASGGPRIYR